MLVTASLLPQSQKSHLSCNSTTESLLTFTWRQITHAQCDSTLLTKPTQGKMDWPLHIPQLLASRSSQEETMQDVSYEQNTLNTTNTITMLNLFQYTWCSAKLSILESCVAFSPSCKAQPWDARTSLPIELHSFKVNKSNRKKQTAKSHFSFKGHNDFSGASSSPI